MEAVTCNRDLRINRFWRSAAQVQMKRGTAELLPRLLRSATRANSAGRQLCTPPCRSSGANKQQCCADVLFSSRGFASSDVDDGKETETRLGPSSSVELPKERQPPAAMQAVSGGDEPQDDGGSTSDGTSTSDTDDELDREVENEDNSEPDTSSEDFEEGGVDPEAGPAPDDAIQAAEPGSLLERIQQASKKQQKFLLRQMLSGKGRDMLMEGGAGQSLEVEQPTASPENFLMKLVDVNRTSKGTKSGGLQSLSAMVVVGNSRGRLGYGIGKSADLITAIRKAEMRAFKRLIYVPIHNKFTIEHGVFAKFGKSKLSMWPKATGELEANPLMQTLAHLAGIRSLGVKIHGSRNTRNSVKAFFDAIGKLQLIQEKARGRDDVLPVEVLFTDYKISQRRWDRIHSWNYRAGVKKTAQLPLTMRRQQYLAGDRHDI